MGGFNGIKKLIALGRANWRGETDPNDTMVIRTIKEGKNRKGKK